VTVFLNLLVISDVIAVVDSDTWFPEVCTLQFHSRYVPAGCVDKQEASHLRKLHRE
jgi:hypothetical protein